MKNLLYILSLSILFILSCENPSPLKSESWIEKPIEQWPDFALTNEIGFSDTTFQSLANSFFVDTGFDTIGISCKHLFLVFKNNFNYSTISLESNFQYWNLYPKHKPNNRSSIRRIINQNANEFIGEYNSLKVRDWILFEIENLNEYIYPLKIRLAPIQKNENLYIVGWGKLQEDNSAPEIIKIKCVRSFKNYSFVKRIDDKIKPDGRSGSPVIDNNGYLVGIASGAEGNLGIIGNINYLVEQFDKYGIKYKE